jgi:hypothetical protein
MKNTCSFTGAGAFEQLEEDWKLLCTRGSPSVFRGLSVGKLDLSLYGNGYTWAGGAAFGPGRASSSASMAREARPAW